MNTSNEAIEDNQEIDLMEIFRTLLSKKLFIILVTSLFAFSSVYYALSLPDKYTSSILVKLTEESSKPQISGLGSIASIAGINIPSGGGDKSSEAIAVLKSKSFLKHLLEFPLIKQNIFAAKGFNKNTKKVIYDPLIFNEEKKLWVREVTGSQKKEPSFIEVYSLFHDDLIIMQDQNTRFIYMSYEHVSPVFAHNLINLLLVELNEVTRVSAIEASSNSLAYLYDELAKTNEKDVRSTINDMIRNQLNIQMLTNVNNDFLLTPIDPAYIPENKSSPQRSLICILGTIFGLFISILITLIKHYLHKENTTHQLK
jgi:uncharacterized protein involved in exopolysaccharide biosynthesis